MIDWLIQQLQTNEFAQGALIAAPATAITYAARAVPEKIWRSMKHFVSYDLVFRSDQEEYYYVSKLITDTVINERWSRDFTYDTVKEYSSNPYQDDTSDALGLTIGYGRHWGRYNGSPVIVHRELEEEAHSEAFKEMLYITFIGMNNGSAKVFADEVRRMMECQSREGSVRVKISAHGGWQNLAEIIPRPISTVFTANGVKEKLLQHLHRFTESKEDCMRKGLPWHTGILLTGKPGGGKTSLVHALAGELKRDINFLNLSGVKSESELVNLITSKSSWKDSVLVIEDIDAAHANTNRDEQNEGQVSLSTLLNILDGFLTPSGLITIATTNHPEALDPALLRAGRFDFVAELGPLGWDEAVAMEQLLLPKGHSILLKEGYEPLMGAVLRERLLQYML